MIKYSKLDDVIVEKKTVREAILRAIIVRPDLRLTIEKGELDDTFGFNFNYNCRVKMKDAKEVLADMITAELISGIRNGYK